MTLIDLDFSNKLEITIHNERPVVLTDLTLALLSVGQQFEKFIENETSDQHQAGSELFIKDVRSGSIVVELIAQALPVLPLLWSGGSLFEWSKYAKDVIEWLSGRLESRQRVRASADVDEARGVVAVVGQVGAAQVELRLPAIEGAVADHRDPEFVRRVLRFPGERRAT